MRAMCYDKLILIARGIAYSISYSIRNGFLTLVKLQVSAYSTSGIGGNTLSLVLYITLSLPYLYRANYSLQQTCFSMSCSLSFSCFRVICLLLKANLACSWLATSDAAFILFLASSFAFSWLIVTNLALCSFSFAFNAEK